MALKQTDSRFFINDPRKAKLQWIKEDKTPLDNCCSFSNYCRLFNDVRPVSSCTGYTMPIEGKK